MNKHRKGIKLPLGNGHHTEKFAHGGDLSTKYSEPLSQYSWNSTGKIGRIGRHLADKPDVKVTMCFGPMPPDASDFPRGIPAFVSIWYRHMYWPMDKFTSCRPTLLSVRPSDDPAIFNFLNVAG